MPVSRQDAEEIATTIGSTPHWARRNLALWMSEKLFRCRVPASVELLLIDVGWDGVGMLKEYAPLADLLTYRHLNLYPLHSKLELTHRLPNRYKVQNQHKYDHSDRRYTDIARRVAAGGPVNDDRDIVKVVGKALSKAEAAIKSLTNKVKLEANESKEAEEDQRMDPSVEMGDQEDVLELKYLPCAPSSRDPATTQGSVSNLVVPADELLVAFSSPEVVAAQARVTEASSSSAVQPAMRASTNNDSSSGSDSDDSDDAAEEASGMRLQNGTAGLVISIGA
jgi:hypothetical protein